MEDGTSVDQNTPLSAWLTFSLAFSDSTRMCSHLRQSCPDPSAIGQLIQRYMDRQDDALCERLKEVSEPHLLQELFSDATARKCEHAMNWMLQSSHHHLLGLDHPAYPLQLQNTDHAPPLLYARGSLSALAYPLLAVVGSRKASHSALAHTRRMCTELADKGLGIISGLALGVDAAAHQGALEARGALRGPTLAVSATPPDRIYPKRHDCLADQIVKSGGLIITEHPLGTRTYPWHFPRRNRIISGLSMGVLVTEAGMPSGTLTTATHAIDQGRDVMAVPGSVHNLQARGCHSLIKQGAGLVENSNDVIDALGDPLQRALAARHGPQEIPQPAGDQAEVTTKQCELMFDNPDLNAMEQALLATLAIQPATIDELMTHCALSVAQLATQLGLLEAKGLVRTSTGGRYSLYQH